MVISIVGHAVLLGVVVVIPLLYATDNLPKAPALLKPVEPTCPDIALVARVTGLVILEATVGADGTVESVRVLRSVRFLEQAAVDAVKQWGYSPLVLSVTLNFSVKES